MLKDDFWILVTKKVLQFQLGTDDLKDVLIKTKTFFLHSIPPPKNEKLELGKAEG